MSLGFALVSSEDAKNVVEQRLNSGWVIFQGEWDMIEMVEEVVYTPGSGRNADFEIIGIVPTIVLGRKTSELRKFLKEPYDFDDILIVTFEARIDSDVKIILTRPGSSKSRAITKISQHVEAILKRGR